MSSPTRRTILKTAALMSGAAALPKAAQARLEQSVSHSCPACGADLGMGDLHKPGCVAAHASFRPNDDEIRPETIKIAKKAKRPGPDDPCAPPGCDRCKIQQAAKGGICYHKNACGCAAQTQC
jgi:hypothetical protein